MSLFTIDGEKCDSCGLCVEECPTLVMNIEKAGDVPTLLPGGEERCINCGHCVAICPVAAFSLKAMSPGDCIPVRKDLLPTGEQAELFLRSRRSTRVFKDMPVPREQLEKLIDIARYAPSGSNEQPVQWLVIEDTKEVRRLSRLVSDWMAMMLKKMPPGVDLARFTSLVERQKMGQDVVTRGAPHLIIAHAPKNLPSAGQDGTIALTYLELAAWLMGLGACWAGFFQMASIYYPPVAESLELPDDHRCTGAMMIGYPSHKFSRIPVRNIPKVIWR